MYELINGNYMAIKEYNSQRVVTFKDIDTVHGRPEGTARRNFNQNKQRFIEGVDYFSISYSEFSTKFVRNPNKGGNPNNAVILITESGYLMLVKSFTDDLSWTVQRELVNIYFKTRTEQPPTAPMLKAMEKRLEALEQLALLSTGAMQQTDIDGDCIAAFVNNCCTQRQRADEVTTRVFYDAFLVWCTKNGIKEPPSKQALISWLFDYYGTNDKRKIKKRMKRRDNSGKIRKDEYYRLTLTPKAKRELGII